MRIRNSLVQQGVLVIVFPLICQIIVVFFLAENVARVRDEQLKTAHARDMISMAHNLMLDTIGGVYEMHADASEDGLLGRETGYKETAKLSKEIAEMKEKAAGNATESRHVLAIDAAARGLLEVFAWVAVQQSQGIHHWKKVDQRCYQVVQDGAKNFVEALQALVDAEQPLMAKNAMSAGNHVNLLFVIALINLALGLGLGLLYVSKIVKALKSIDQNRVLLSERKPLLHEISAHDELMQLDRAVHSAAASLSSALESGSKMINEAGNLICSIDNDLLFLEANPAALKIIGLEPEQLVGRSVREFIDSEAADKLRHVQALKENSALEIELRRPDGSKIHTHWALKAAEAPGVLFCVIQDISEQKRREGMRQRFLDAVRASLRTPIASIVESLQKVITSSALDKSEENVQKVRADLQRAGRSARQCILLIDVLLDAQSAETGSIKIEPVSVSIGQIVDDAVELVKTIAEKKAVVFERELVSTVVMCDAFKLTQTTVNFLSNAIKFSPEGGKITVAIEETEDFLEVSVTDEGPGISEEYRVKIFEPFVQVPGEKAKEGTGLGLAICKQIVQGHHGEIGVRSSALGSADGADRADGTDTAGATGRTGSTFWYKIPKNRQTLSK